MGLKELKKDALIRLNDCRDFLIQIVKDRTTELQEVLAIPFDDLPQHINECDDLKREMVLARLRKEDITKSINFVIQSLSNTEFSYEDYRDIGRNDGELSVLSMIFKHLGDTPNELEALNWMYTD
jgi:hypothetical protein